MVVRRVEVVSLKPFVKVATLPSGVKRITADHTINNIFFRALKFEIWGDKQ